jgi:hypothetical protein
MPGPGSKNCWNDDDEIEMGQESKEDRFMQMQKIVVDREQRTAAQR